MIVEAATVGIPAILINNPNNKSPELGINPTLVATSEDPDELVQIIQSFFNDTDTYVRECLEWNLGKRKQMLATSSIKGLVAHFNNQIDNRKKNE